MARAHRCCVERVASPAIRNGIPGMIGRMMPNSPTTRQAHPTILSHNELCCRIGFLSIGHPRGQPAAPHFYAAKPFRMRRLSAICLWYGRTTAANDLDGCECRPGAPSFTLFVKGGREFTQFPENHKLKAES